MSERDVQRIEVLSKVVDGRMTLVSAARVLGLSERQVRRLLDRIRTNGAASIRHKAIGRPSNNRISPGMRDYVLAIVRERYWDFGPTLAAEKLLEDDGVTVSRETLRQWMFDKDQRVTHAAITENKRLGDVLAYIKERQDQRPTPKVRTNSEKNGYKPRGRKPGRTKDLHERSSGECAATTSAL
jgi:transposase